MKKYLVVISYCEEEAHFFDTKKEMLDYFNVKSIEALVKKSDFFSTYTVYEVCNVWRDN